MLTSDYNYTENLNLAIPAETNYYALSDTVENFKKIDNFAGLTPPKALTANKLTSAKNINGVAFDGTTNVITGLGLYSENETYNENNIAYKFDDNNKISVKRSKIDNNIGNDFNNENYWEDVPLGTSDNIPFFLGMSIYSKETPNDEGNISWLLSNEQWSPKTSYPDYYNWILNNVNSSKEGFKLSSADDITDYDFVINTEDETFRLPLLNGTENIIDYDNGTDTQPMNTVYQAPCNGYVEYNAYISASSKSTLYIGNSPDSFQASFHQSRDNNTCNGVNTIIVPIKAGQYYKIEGGISGTWTRFFPVKGNGSLYYYVGAVVENQGLIDAGALQQQLALKLDKSQVASYITETYYNSDTGSGYTVYSDGRCEQYGAYNAASIGGWQTVNFLKTFANTDYFISVVEVNSTFREFNIDGTHPDYFRYEARNITADKVRWYAVGYLAQGE